MNSILKVFLRVCSRVFQLFPRRVALEIGAGLGSAAFVLLAPRTRLAIRNFNASIGGGSFRGGATIFRMYRHFGRNLVDFLRLSRIDQRTGKETFLDSVEVEGVEHLQEAFREGKGVLALTAHLGNWEVMAARVVSLGFPVNIVVKRIRQPVLDQFLNSIRKGAGVHPIPKTDSAREIISRLKKNELVGFVLDQRVSRSEGVPTTFFGRPAMTISALALLALRFDIPVIPIFTFRNNDLNHRVVISPRVAVPLSGNREADIRTMTQAYTEIIEKGVRDYPDQWIWLHQRWNKR